MKKYYITTPIFYVNDAPHIGHAYNMVAADFVKRFRELNGQGVFLLTGTDEYGLKVEKSAKNLGKDPQEFADFHSASFKKLAEVFSISYDDFIRTTEERHRKGVIALWKELEESGNIYKGKYSGYYSMRDEAFYDSSELTEEGLAPTGAPVEWLEEECYFFALSKWESFLLDFYEKNPDFIFPASRKNEVVSFVKQGLKDLCVSRPSLKWGIEVPGGGGVIYVWLDALTNYISALGYPAETGRYLEFWPADCHLVGKDILRFHAIYWPAFLKASGIPLPKKIVAHGWWTENGRKISKSLGNAIDPFKLVEEFGLGRVRYFLLRAMKFGSDGDYSGSSFVSICNSELSNKIGNLVQRTISFAHKNNGGKVPEISKEYLEKSYEEGLLKKFIDISKENVKIIEDFRLETILGNIVALAEEANIFIDREAPWVLKKENPELMGCVIYILLESIRILAINLLPIVPSEASKILNILGIVEKERSFLYLSRGALKPGSPLKEPFPIFPRIEE